MEPLIIDYFHQDTVAMVFRNIVSPFGIHANGVAVRWSIAMRTCRLFGFEKQQRDFAVNCFLVGSSFGKRRLRLYPVFGLLIGVRHLIIVMKVLITISPAYRGLWTHLVSIEERRD